MASLADLEILTATASEDQSTDLVNEIYTKSTWRMYVSYTNPATEALADRFMKHHSKVPGGLVETLPGIIPVAVFDMVNKMGVRLFGTYYLNGSVMRMDYPENILKETGFKGKQYALFIDEQTATQWGYPDGWSNLEDRTNLINRANEVLRKANEE